MHLLVGIFNVLLAHTLTSLYLKTGLKAAGRAAVRRCCAAYYAGAGVDEEALRVLLRFPSDAEDFLAESTTTHGDTEMAEHLLKLLKMR